MNICSNLDTILNIQVFNSVVVTFEGLNFDVAIACPLLLGFLQR
jgi:hypothetical protein